MSMHLHANVFYFCAKTQLQMFQFDLYHELSFVQIVSSHYTLFFLHILKMMNATMTIQPTTEYLALLHALFFTTPL